MNLDIITGVIAAVFGGVAVHYFTKDRMNNKFTEVMNKMREDYVNVSVCKTCQTTQGERRTEMGTWMRTIEEKLDRVIEKMIK